MRGRPFKKGEGGRKPGVPNKETAIQREAARAVAAQVLLNPRTAERHARHVERFPDGRLSMFYYEHLYGKATEVVDMQHAGGILLSWRKRPDESPK